MIFSLILLGILLVAQGILQMYGWTLLEQNLPVILTYRAPIETAITVIIGIVAIYAIDRVLRSVLDKGFSKVLRGNPLAQKLLPLLKHIGTFLVWGFGGFFLLSSIGINISALVTGAGVGGLVFALASKELASNLFGSLSLVFGKFFKISDRIRIKGFEGTVQEISLSTTKLVDKAGHVVFVPNKFIIGDPIENLSEIERSSFSMTVNFPLAIDFEGAREKLTKKAEKLGGKAVLVMNEYCIDKIIAKLSIESAPENFDAVKSGVIGELRKILS